MADEVPYSHDPAWPVVRLGDVTTKIGSGATPRGGSESYLAARDTFAFVRSQNIFDRWFDASALAFISDHQADALRGVWLQPGDVLLNITGDGITFGRAALVAESALPACVNQHVSIVRADPSKADPGYLLAYLTHPDVKPYIASFNSGGSRRAVTKGHIQSFRVPLPSIAVQRSISAVLASLDAKIDSNRKQRLLLRQLGRAKLDASLGSARVDVRLADVAASIARGVAPKYADEDPNAPLVINQKCVRDGWVSTAPARRMVARPVAPEKKGTSGDVFVNSTGTGTLGRVGRWHSGDIFVDGHVTIVRPDPESISPAVLAYSLLGREDDIEAMATGSTGQTELSAVRLGDLVFGIPPRADADELEAELTGFEERIASLFVEEETLVRLRDVLLPELLSGRIRVREAATDLKAAA